MPLSPSDSFSIPGISEGTYKLLTFSSHQHTTTDRIWMIWMYTAILKLNECASSNNPSYA